MTRQQREPIHLSVPVGHEQLLRAFLLGRSPQTLRAYKADLKSFATFVGVAVKVYQGIDPDWL